MSYHIYSTEGIILSNNLAGESNRFYHMYTRDLGLIGVWGQGTRKLESKLRYNLKDLTLVRVHVVRGKNLWRLTDVERIDGCEGIHADSKKREALGKIASLLKRLVDEGGDEELYQLFSNALRTIDTQSNPNVLADTELLFVVRMLEHLGYGRIALTKELLDHEMWDEQVLRLVQHNRQKLARAVNTSLLETHM